jgi:hypothetical protein
MATNDTLLLQVMGNQVGNQHIHTLAFRQVVPDGTPSQLITAWRTAAETQYRAIFHTTTTPVEKIKCGYICGTLPLGAPEELELIGTARNGTRSTAGDQSPSFLASYTKLRTALAGRSRQGKFFIGGLLETDVAYNDIQASYLTLIAAYNAALVAAFVTPGIGANWRLVVHSRKLAAVPGTQCQTSSAPVTTITTTVGVTTMRSRKTGHGI